MVKLTFNKNSLSSLTSLTSLTSKKVEKNLNPFKKEDYLQEDECLTTIKLKKLVTKDLVGLENCHFVLKKWYETYQENVGKNLLIIGPTGCGKTTLVNLFCEEEKINFLDIRLNDIKTKKDILKEIEYFISYSNNNFFIRNNSKKLILIDNYHTGLNFSLTDISEIKIPIVIISSDSKGSKLSELKKVSEVYYINEINKGLLKTWINTLTKDLSDEQVGFIIRTCKSDKRLTLNLLNFIKDYSFKNLNLFLETYYKDIDINHFDFIKELFDNIEIININKIFNVYETDGYILSNLVHENYIDYTQDINLLAEAAEYISCGDILYSDTYDSTRTFLPEIHCLNSLVLPGYFSRTDKVSKQQLRPSCINNRYNIYLNNLKIIDKINESNVLKLNIFDIYSIKSILNQELIKSKTLNTSKIEFVKNVMNTFNDNKINKLEMIYKHFYDFKDHTGKEIKTKNFTLKFKEKLKEKNELIN